MRVTHLTITLALIAGFVPLSSRAQRAPPTKEPSQPETTAVQEQVEVHLVEIAVRARQGRPVDDLTADEIAVRDRGRKMRVAFLDRFVQEPPAELPPDVRLYVAAPGSEETTARSMSATPRYLILFVDVENDYRLLKQQAIDDAARFVREELAPPYRVAVLAYDGEIHLEQSFTDDRELVSTALMRAYDRPARPALDLQARMRSLVASLEECAVGSGSVTRTGDESCLRGGMLEYADEVRPAAKGYLAALEGVIRFAAGLRSRATVVALSHGVAVDPAAELLEAMRAVYGNTEQIAQLQLEVGFGEGARLEMDRLLKLALQDRVTLHFVDRNPPPSGDFSARLGTPYQPGTRPMQAAFSAAQSDLRQIAAQTGGVYVHSTDVFAGLEQVIELDRGGYLLGYYLDDRLPFEQLRKVRIRTTRKGVRLLNRRAYYARREEPARLVGSIHLGAPLSLEEDGRPGRFVPFIIRADPHKLGYEIVGEWAGADLTLHVQVSAASGRSLAESYHFINHAYARDLWEAGEVEPIEIHGWMELPPGSYRLTAYLRNPTTGERGELGQDVTVPIVEGDGVLPTEHQPAADRPGS